MPGLARLHGHSLFTNCFPFRTVPISEDLSWRNIGDLGSLQRVRSLCRRAVREHHTPCDLFGLISLADSKRNRTSDQPEHHCLTTAGNPTLPYYDSTRTWVAAATRTRRTSRFKSLNLRHWIRVKKYVLQIDSGRCTFTFHALTFPRAL